MFALHTRVLPAAWLVVWLVVPARAEAPFRYPEAQHGKGRLQYVGPIPVLTIQGTPKELGEQLGMLALRPARQLPRAADQLVAQYGWQAIYTLVMKSGNVLLPRFSADHLQELDAAAAASEWSRDWLVFSNTILDLRHIVLCSALLVEAERSATGGPLFGRNLDWPPAAGLQEYSLVVVCRPEGKRAFASVTFPGVLGCVSGMNDAGLAVAMLDVYSTRDGSSSFNAQGTPTALLLRRVLEECSSIDEAQALLRATQRASKLNIAICDTQRAAVLEVTPSNVVLRQAHEGICICTNHFRSSELATSTRCWRYAQLAGSVTSQPMGVADIQRRLHAVHQGRMTLQTMIFEPATLRLHLAFGRGPATRLALQSIELSRWLRPQGGTDSPRQAPQAGPAQAAQMPGAVQPAQRPSAVPVP
jgi:isopenicillin-N N-acyltransferase-like protein